MKIAVQILLTFFASGLFSGALLKALQLGMLGELQAIAVGAMAGVAALISWFTWLSLKPTAPLFMLAFLAGTVLGVL